SYPHRRMRPITRPTRRLPIRSPLRSSIPPPSTVSPTPVIIGETSLFPHSSSQLQHLSPNSSISFSLLIFHLSLTYTFPLLHNLPLMLSLSLFLTHSLSSPHLP